MNWYDTFILAFVESLTEFLPVSSTGHLIVISEFLNLKQSDFLKSFEIIIQLGAILAIVFIYRNKINFSEKNLWLNVFLSFIPLGVIGFIFKDQIKLLFDIKIVALMFIIGGFFILFFEYFYKKNKEVKKENLKKITYKESLYIGIFQIFSLIPGTSRSLTTIFGGMFFKISRKTAAEFSFLMALPVMFAVSFYEIISSYETLINNKEYKFLLIGFLLSFFFTFIVVKLFLKFIENFSFVFFGYYRIIFGIFLFLFFV